MRALVAIVVACVGLIALLAWQLRLPAPRNEQRGPSVSSMVTKPIFKDESIQPPATQETASPAVRFSNEEESAPALEQRIDRGGKGTEGGVRWASDIERGVRERNAIAARATDSDSDAALERAIVAAQSLEHWDEVLELLARKIERQPDDLDARFQHATVLMRLRLWAQAVTELKSVVELSPESAAAWFNRGVAEQELGRLGDARASWDKCLALAPDNLEARARRGVLLLDLSQWQAAADDFRAVLVRDPDSIDATMNLSLALAKLGQTDAARHTISSLLEAHPRNVLALNRMGELCWLQSRAESGGNAELRSAAVGWWERSLEIDPAQPEARAFLDQVRAEERDLE